MKRILGKYGMFLAFSALLCCSKNDVNAAIIGNSGYFEDFDDNVADNFNALTVNSSVAGYPALTDRWSTSSQRHNFTIPNLYPSDGVQIIRGTSQIQLTDAYELLTAGVDITMSSNMSIIDIQGTSSYQTAMRMFADNSTTGSSNNFFGLHGWEAEFRVPNFGPPIGTAARLALYDYGGTNGAGGSPNSFTGANGGATGQTHNTVSNLANFTFQLGEVYTLSMRAHLVQASEIIANGGTEANANLGRVRITASILDPDLDNDGSNGLQPSTASVTGVSLATLAANSGMNAANGEYFGMYGSNVFGGSGSFQFNSGAHQWDNFSVIPEPSTFAFAGLALVGLGFAKIRKHRAASTSK